MQPRHSSHTVSATSTSLLIRAIADDSDAWDRLVTIYGPLVYRWCRGTLQECDAGDVVQDVFVAVSKNLPRFQHSESKSTFRGWLRVITRNKVIDFVRARDRAGKARGGSDAHAHLQQLEAEITDSIGSHDDLENEHLGLLMRALEVIECDFSEQVWDVFYRSTIQGRPTADVADEIGQSEKYVRNVKYRVKKRLVEELGDLGDFAL